MNKTITKTLVVQSYSKKNIILLLQIKIGKKKKKLEKKLKNVT